MSELTLIEASNGAKPKVVGVAYSGGKMNLPGWRHPVVVDLAGMEIPESVPLLTNHENKTDSRIGLISAAVRNNVLEITGEIVSDSKDAADIIAQGKAGADWQLSIGADVKECELVKGSREVNGQEVEGPFYHIKKSTLREVSVVLRGVLAPVHLEDVNRISFVPVQPVVVVIAPIAAVAGAGRFAGLTPAVKRPYAGYGDFACAAVLIARSQRGHNKGTEQNQGEDEG